MQNDNERDVVHFGTRLLLAIAATMTLLLYGAAMALLALPVLLVVALRGLARMANNVPKLAPPALAFEAVVVRLPQPAIACIR